MLQKAMVGFGAGGSQTAGNRGPRDKDLVAAVNPILLRRYLPMIRVAATAGVWIGLAVMSSGAERRWCSIASLGPGQNLIYPPIAKAARVEGLVMERVIYSRGGGSTSFEYISGPPLLSAGLENQIKEWKIGTTSTGDALCVTLVIAEFKLDDSLTGSVAKPIDVSVPSILRMRVSAAPLIISDPAGEVVGKAPLFSRVRYAVRKGFRRLFCARN
jgi:hypothetical protein